PMGTNPVEARVPSRIVCLAVVAVAARGCRYGRIDRDEVSAEDPRAVARREPRCKEPVVDLPRHREVLPLGRVHEEAVIRLAAVRGLFEISLLERNDAVAVRVDATDFERVCVEEALSNVGDERLEG